MVYMNTEIEFWQSKTIDENQCWIWNGPKDKSGYGSCRYDGISWRVIRLSLFLTTGENPGHKYACHKCDNPECFNPDHLYWGSPAQNVNDMVSRTFINGKYGGLCMRGHDQQIHGKSINNGTSVSCIPCGRLKEIAKKLYNKQKITAPSYKTLEQYGYKDDHARLIMDYLGIDINENTILTEYRAIRNGVTLTISYSLEEAESYLPTGASLEKREIVIHNWLSA